jgi:hypothetical protein
MATTGNGRHCFDTVLRFFEEDQWNFQQLENKPVIKAGYRGMHGTWICHAKVEEEAGRFLFSSQMGLNVPPGLRLAVAEYLTRANTLLTLGNFEMNMDTGDIRCRVGVEAPDGELTVPMVRALVHATVSAMDRFFPGVLAVIHSGLSPAAAIARVVAEPVRLF